MGGKSSSSNAQTSTQTSVALDADGVVGDLYQSAGGLSVINDFPESVQQAFGKLIDLTGQSLDLAQGAGQIAIDAVTSTTQTANNPEITALEKIVPVLMLGSLAIVAIFYFKGKK